MILKFEEYKISKELVEDILKTNIDLIDELIENVIKTLDKERTNPFLIHTNSLLLNVLLNRLQEVDKEAENNAKKAREILRKKIK